MASPIPLPSAERGPRAPDPVEPLEQRASSPAGMPMPVSATVEHAPCRPRGAAATAIRPSKVNFSALDSRLRTIFSHDSRSTQTGSPQRPDSRTT